MKKKSGTGKLGTRRRTIMWSAAGLAAVAVLYWLGQLQQQRVVRPVDSNLPNPPTQPEATSQPTTSTRVPPYYERADAAKPFPALLPASYFRRSPLVERAYQIAAAIPEVLVQQPCYCFCDKYGHRSLLDCYASDHGAG